MEKTKSAYCDVCKEQRLFSGRKTNKGVHTVLTVITLGLWSVIWPLFATASTRLRCAVCGSTLPGSERKTGLGRAKSDVEKIAKVVRRRT